MKCQFNKINYRKSINNLLLLNIKNFVIKQKIIFVQNFMMAIVQNHNLDRNL